MSAQKPTLIAYTVKARGKGQKSIWTKIEAACGRTAAAAASPSSSKPIR